MTVPMGKKPALRLPMKLWVLIKPITNYKSHCLRIRACSLRAVANPKLTIDSSCSNYKGTPDYICSIDDISNSSVSTLKANLQRCYTNCTSRNCLCVGSTMKPPPSIISIVTPTGKHLNLNWEWCKALDNACIIAWTMSWSSSIIWNEQRIWEPL